MNVAYALNRLWMTRCRGEAVRFQAATKAVANAQSDRLRAILAANRNCQYGHRHGFASIAAIGEYQRRVPCVTYDALSADVDRIAAGASAVLTAAPVQRLEPTGGSTAAEKLIPYTASLRRQYQRAIAPWIWDAMRRFPQSRQGQAYWSISPAMGSPRVAAGGIPVGFGDDTAYLPGWQRWAANRLLAVPTDLARISQIDDFRYLTLLYLFAARDLSLISVWSPTFLISLLASLPAWQDRLCCDLQRGAASLPSGQQAAPLTISLGARRRRAAEVTEAFRSAGTLGQQLQATWPRLALISCWADGSAALFVPDLKRLFPEVPIQPKGLLATEGAVSFPWGDAEGGALSIRSHFFEFAPADEPADQHAAMPKLAHQLDRGGRYRVILTTGGGLYRYDLNDNVEVVGFENQCPRLRFLGRANRTSDLVGEKLAETHAQEAVQLALQQLNMAPGFALLAPVLARPPHYALFLQDSQSESVADKGSGLADAIHSRLESNPHYRHAIRLGQLAPVKVQFLSGDASSAWRLFEAQSRKRGQTIGAIKPCLFDPWTGWAEVFAELIPRGVGGDTFV